MYPPASAILPPPTSLAPIVAVESEEEEPLAEALVTESE